MSIRFNNAEGGTNGSAVTIANSAGSGAAFDSVTAGVIYSNAAAGHGTLGYRTTAASTQYTQWSFTDTVANLKSVLSFDALPAGVTPMRIGLSTGSVSIILLSDGRPQLYQGSGRASGSTPLAAGTKYRFTLWVDTAAGSIRASIYPVDSTTVFWDSGIISGLTLAAPTTGQVGKYDGTSIPTNWDDVSLKTAGDGAYDPSPFTEALATPVVTLGAKVDPTTVGGNEGKQTVTWPAVPNATGYDAYIANGSTPTQSDFVLIASNITSPFTFTLLTAGTRSYGIKAKV